MAGDDVKSFEVAFECDATGVGAMRCEMDVRLMVPEVIEWEMASDEYGFHGGDGTAPLPIAYFIAGLTSCLMTQMRAFSNACASISRTRRFPAAASGSPPRRAARPMSLRPRASPWISPWKRSHRSKTSSA